MIRTPYRDKAISLARAKGIARARDFDAIGVPRIYLRRLEKEGVLVRPARGVYQLADADLSATHSLAEAAQVSSKGVVGLLSALQFHELTTQTPYEVWLLLPSKAWAPTNPPVRLRIIRAGEKSLSAGVERHTIDGVPVPITSPAKTVADCFKYRNRIGLDVAIEALREALRSKKATADAIWRFAEINRVATIMRPFLEAMQ
jgi:predicted transcriptional regulator of viral defense system